MALGVWVVSRLLMWKTRVNIWVVGVVNLLTKSS